MSKEELRSRFKMAGANQPTRRPAPAAMPAAPPPIRSEDLTPAPAPTVTAKRFKKLALPAVITIVVLGLAAAGYAYFRPSHAPNKTTTLGQSISKLVSIPAYYPQNLPAGYSYNNDARTIKANVLYFSVTGPNNKTFF